MGNGSYENKDNNRQHKTLMIKHTTTSPRNIEHVMQHQYEKMKNWAQAGLKICSESGLHAANLGEHRGNILLDASHYTKSHHGAASTQASGQVLK